MPALTYEYSGARHGGKIDGRVLIGRKLTHGVVIADPAVSRLHAWIDNRQGVFVLTDAGSRTGTFVNGEAIVRWELQPGDEIRIGPANLTFRSEDSVPEDVQEINLSTRGSTVQSTKSGILFDCKCGSPLWVATEFAGKRGLCRYCGEPVTVPIPPPPGAEPVKKKIRPLAPTKPRAKCGVCHSPIENEEEITVCQECLTNYHTDCWHENYGCSTYGCSQVNALKPAVVAEEEAKIAAEVAEVEPRIATPWELILMAGSLVGSLVGAVLFGIPAAVVAVACAIRLSKGANAKRGILVGAFVLSILGVAIGAASSDVFWFAGKHLP